MDFARHVRSRIQGVAQFFLPCTPSPKPAAVIFWRLLSLNQWNVLFLPLIGFSPGENFLRAATSEFSINPSPNFSAMSNCPAHSNECSTTRGELCNSWKRCHVSSLKKLIMTKSLSFPNPTGQFLLYQTEDGQTKLEVRLENDSLWLTQAHLAELFQTTAQNITLHLKNIFDAEELNEAATCKECLQVQNEGARQISRTRKFYNLEAITSRLPGKPPRRLLPKEPMPPNPTWVLRIGTAPRCAKAM